MVTHRLVNTGGREDGKTGRLSDGRRQMGCVPGSKREKRFLRWTGLSPRGFGGLTAAAPLRVVVSPPLAAMSIYAAFGSENLITALAGEGKQANRPAGVGNTPLLVLTHHFPRRGKSVLRSALGIISTSLHSTAKSSPSGGKVVPKVPKGVYFHAPKARLYGFPFRGAEL